MVPVHKQFDSTGHVGRVTLWEYVPNRSGSAEPPTDLNVRGAIASLRELSAFFQRGCILLCPPPFLATTSSKRAAASLEPHDRLLLMMHTEGLHPQGVTQRSASTLPTPIVPSDRAEIPRFPELQFCQGPLLPSWAHPVLGLSSGAGWALLIASHPCTEGSEELYQLAPSAELAYRPANSPVDWGSVPIQPANYE